MLKTFLFRSRSLSRNFQSEVFPRKKSASLSLAEIEPRVLETANDNAEQELRVLELNKLPKKSSALTAIHIIDQGVAELASSALFTEENSAEDSLVFEMNPGPGILTTQLLHNPKVKELCVFEPRNIYHHPLHQLKLEYHQLDVVRENLLNLPHLISGKEKLMKCIFNKIPVRQKWTDPPPLKIVGIIPPRKPNFLRYLMVKLPQFDSVYSFGRMEALFFISSKEFSYLTARNTDLYTKYRDVSVLFQSLFDFELIDTVPLSSFSPRLTIIKAYRRIKYDINADKLFLVRFIPKLSLQDTDSLFNQFLPDFHFFTMQSYCKRTNCVIPTLEKWMPDCGPRLIKLGIPMFKRFGELSPEEFRSLFEELVSWPEYADSVLRTASVQINHATDFSFDPGISDVIGEEEE